MILRQRVGHRRDRTQDRGRVGAQCHCNREGPVRVGTREVAEVERAATMGEPAHDDLAPADHLLTIDAQVLPQARRGYRLRPARDRQAPGNQRAGVTWPAGLHRQPGQIDVIAFYNDVLARRAANGRRLHIPYGLEHLQQASRVLETARWLGFLQARQHSAHVTQARQILRAHGQRHPFRGTEQVDQRRNFVTYWMFNQHCRTTSAKYAVSECCHLQPRRYGLDDPSQLASGFELAEEVTQITVFHISVTVSKVKSKDLTGYYVAS